MLTDVIGDNPYAAGERKGLLPVASPGSRPLSVGIGSDHRLTLRSATVPPLRVRWRSVRAAARRRRRRRRRKGKGKKRRKRGRKKRKRKRKRKRKGKRKRPKKKRRKFKRKKRKRRKGKQRRKGRRRRRKKRKRKRKGRKKKKFGRRRRKFRRRKKTRLRPSATPYMSHIMFKLTGRSRPLSRNRNKKISAVLIPTGRFPPKKSSETLRRGGAAAAHLLNVMDRLITKVSYNYATCYSSSKPVRLSRNWLATVVGGVCKSYKTSPLAGLGRRWLTVPKGDQLSCSEPIVIYRRRP